MHCLFTDNGSVSIIFAVTIQHHPFSDNTVPSKPSIEQTDLHTERNAIKP